MNDLDLYDTRLDEPPDEPDETDSICGFTDEELEEADFLFDRENDR